MDQYKKYSNGQLLKDRYLKVADLSEGSYGLVSVAKDTKLNTLVAVKYIYPLDYKKDSSRPSSSPAKMRHDEKKEDKGRQNTHDILKSLYEEAAKEISIHKILGSHQNVSALHDHFDSYLILQYCSRGDLYEAIQNGQGPTTPKDIKDVFYQILDAIEYCHSKGVYHRDLKPENILIGDDWTIKLCDWGLATTNLIITDRSEFDVGSERYMAPELFDTNLKQYDASRIDIWSIGIILLTIIFHKNPFEVANYSDKRFVQFATNRESLFDIFSTMTGDLFSVLRYCLNIDPNNRELSFVRNELDILNYFTIDDEDWVSDEYSDTDDEVYDHHDELHTPIVEIEDVDNDADNENSESPDNENTDELDDEEGDSTFYMDEDADRSNSTLNKDKILEPPKELTSPIFNERAEALLSNSTTLKPIPISNGTNNYRSKFFRNSRKPISVASYNSYQKPTQNHSYQSHKNNKFNREDFFTPKSVFNHYMTKYSDKNERPRKNNNKTNDWKKNNNQPKTWKKNYRNTRHKKKNGNQTDRIYHKKNEFSNFNTPIQPRRKSNSFSMSKSKNRNQLGTSYQSNNSVSNSLGHSVSSNGKYVPPFMRSPHYTKSPNVTPLHEAMDNLHLNDYEVFQLEDDDFSLDNPLPIENNLQNHNHHDNNDTHKAFDKPKHMHEMTRPMSLNNEISASDTNGKYVPPFRRGSHGGHSQPINSLNINHNNPVPNNKRRSKHYMDTFNQLNGASSVPNSSTDWFSYRKDWTVYD
ncbi:serine/threonine-protein kinase Ksp1p [[Candida] jaroonii]|uniref:Serine/threonine-protein kinase Ksp1p n=1 Tax=[Candida] jaroonii TaxID=467808 RepID=A0ACA9Y821_9ASCO|nr:serine/threonine-protein kinase Ksp1p [[Candida] jaroonii]